MNAVKRKSNIRRIHHFDDEPELIRWIPNTLYRRYRRHYRDWIVAPDFSESDNGTTTRFMLHPHGPNGVSWQLEYRFYRTTEDFDTNFRRLADVGDFALMDLMIFNSDRQMVPHGRTRFDKAREVLGEDHVYFLTAYPLELKPSIDDRYLIYKPPNAQRIVDLLIRNLRFE